MTFGEAGNPGVKVNFSNGNEITLPPRALSHDSASKNSVSRETLALKSILAWTLDWIAKGARPRINPGLYDRVRRDFENFQRQEILESVSLPAIASLHNEIQRVKNIRGIKWDGSGAFKLEADVR
jgi:hypothetical protein